MANILITGTGLVADKLSQDLSNKGHSVSFLSRGETNPSKNIFKWDIEQSYIDPKALNDVDYIIHLAGANIGAKRWSRSRKEIVIRSRVESANLIFNKIVENNVKIKHFISASAVGYYGSVTSDKIFTENDGPADDFLGQVCQKWEGAADQFSTVSDIVTKLRIGVVLSPNGGALDKMLSPIKFGIGSPLGSGKQYMPWIHIDDLSEMFSFVIENKLEGVFNAAAPDHKPNKEFLKQCAETLNKPFFMPKVPEFLLKLILGEMSDMITKGSRVSSNKIIKTGYEFQYPDLRSALENVLR